MSDCPAGWAKTSFGAVFTESHERRRDRDDLPVLSVTKTRGPMLASERFGKTLHSRDLSKYRVARYGTIVADPMLLWDGSIGRQEVVDEGVVSPDYRVYELSQSVSSEFMRYVVRNPRMFRYYQGGARGTNVRRNRIARSDFLRIPLNLPPLPEQRRIAAILSSVEEVIAKTEGVIEQLQVVKKTIMQELLTCGLPGRHTLFKPLPSEWRLGRVSSNVREIPSAWDLVVLTTVCRLESGHTPSRREPEYWKGNIPWVSLHDAKALDVPEIHDTAQTIGERGLANSSARLLPAGTVVFSRTATVGKATVLGREMATSQDFANYVCGERIHNRYLMHVLRHMKAEWDRLMAGSTHQTIYMPVFRDLQVLLPPMEEQREIAAIADDIDIRLRAESATIFHLRSVKSALVSVLLTGELRVTSGEGAA